MAAAVRLREDDEAGRLRELAKRSEDANQTRRLLALAAIYDGGSRDDAARIGGVGLQMNEGKVVYEENVWTPFNDRADLNRELVSLSGKFRVGPGRDPVIHCRVCERKVMSVA